MYMEARGHHVLFSDMLSTSFKTGLSLECSSPIMLDWLISESQGFPCLSIPSAGVTSMCHHAGHFYRASTQDLVARSLPTELFSNP